MNEVIKYFLRFCKDENIIFKSYIVETLIDYIKSLEKIKSLEERDQRFTYEITNIFNKKLSWAATAEGHTFWYEIHMKWENFIYDTPYGNEEKIREDFNHSWYMDKDEVEKHDNYLKQKEIFEKKCQQHLNMQN